MFGIHEKQIKDLASLHARGQLGHAYIFFGDPNTGKAAAARALARYIETGLWASSEDSGTDAPHNQTPLTDTQVFSPDEKNSIGIDAARSVKMFLSEKPFISSRRVAIIDRAQAMTPEAQNALLKVAEEPPASALLILVMPDPELLWPTLRSRFQKIYFPPPARKEMKEILKEKADPMAARFFETAPAARKDFVKELTEPEDFNFAAFLDSLIAHLAAEGASSALNPAKNGRLWHAVLELRRMQDATNLSPRIQLMNLWTLI
jgi:DNA polymerase-3 subunit delta'